MGDLLSTSSSAFGVTTSVVDARFNSVNEMIFTAFCLASKTIPKPKTLTTESKNDMHKLIKENTSRLDKVLSSLSPVVKFVLN